MHKIVSTPDLCDQFDQKIDIVAPIFRHYGGVQQAYGQIATVACFEDNSLVAEQVKLPGKGRVLVVDGGASMRCSLLGDQLAATAIDNGWSAILINGCLRDVEIIVSMPILIMALASVPRKTIKAGKGKLNMPVEFGGVSFEPDHYLFADQTGIIVAKDNLLALSG